MATTKPISNSPRANQSDADRSGTNQCDASQVSVDPSDPTLGSLSALPSLAAFKVLSDYERRLGITLDQTKILKLAFERTAGNLWHRSHRNQLRPPQDAVPGPGTRGWNAEGPAELQWLEERLSVAVLGGGSDASLPGYAAVLLGMVAATLDLQAWYEADAAVARDAAEGVAAVRLLFEGHLSADFLGDSLSEISTGFHELGRPRVATLAAILAVSYGYTADRSAADRTAAWALVRRGIEILDPLLAAPGAKSDSIARARVAVAASDKKAAVKARGHRR